MSRRNTIIIATLVNAALLMILFATAMRSDDSKLKTSSKRAETKLDDFVLNTSVASPVKSQQSPEDVFNDFMSSVPTLGESGSETLFSFEESAIDSALVEVVHTPKPIAAPTHSQELKESVSGPLQGQYVNVVVKKGDVLEKIAKTHNTTVAAVMKANHMNSSSLKIGQVLKIPLDGKRTSAPSLPHPSSKDMEYYIVKEGDNPWLIASRNKINLEELLRINGLDEQKAKRLRPGDKLKIR